MDSTATDHTCSACTCPTCGTAWWSNGTQGTTTLVFENCSDCWGSTSEFVYLEPADDDEFEPAPPPPIELKAPATGRQLADGPRVHKPRRRSGGLGVRNFRRAA